MPQICHNFETQTTTHMHPRFPLHSCFSMSFSVVASPQSCWKVYRTVESRPYMQLATVNSVWIYVLQYTCTKITAHKKLSAAQQWIPGPFLWFFEWAGERTIPRPLNCFQKQRVGYRVVQRFVSRNTSRNVCGRVQGEVQFSALVQLVPLISCWIEATGDINYLTWLLHLYTKLCGNCVLASRLSPHRLH